MTFVNLIINPDQSIKDAISQIKATSHRTLIVAKSDLKLIGSISEGDILRFLLQGGVITAPIAQALNSNPIRSQRLLKRQEFLKITKDTGIILVPITNSDNQIVNIQTISEFL